MMDTSITHEKFMENHTRKLVVGVGGSTGSGSVLSERFANRREPSRGVGSDERTAGVKELV
jgi:hypothetical protein